MTEQETLLIEKLIQTIERLESKLDQAQTVNHYHHTVPSQRLGTYQVSTWEICNTAHAPPSAQGPIYTQYTGPNRL